MIRGQDNVELRSPGVAQLPDRRTVTSPVSPSASAVPPIAANSSQADEIQVCGGAWLKLNTDGRVGEPEANDFEQRSVEATRLPTLKAMESSPDERTRAAVQLLQMADTETQSAGAHRDALARLARDSTDPQVYAWAYRACSAGASAPEGACQLINAEQWARLDPSNGVPWLVIAGDAETRHDASGLDDAMFHMASAERQDTGRGALPATVLDHIPAGEEFLLGARGLEMEAIGIDAAGSMPYMTIMRYCATDNLADANRRQTCERVAELLVERSTTLIDLGIGASVGKRFLDWPEDQNRALEDRRAALFGAFPRELPDTNAELLMSCTRIRRELSRVRDVGKYGEIDSLRRVVAASGKDLPQLASENRKWVREELGRMHPEAAPASASSSAESNR
jgi:hypothetical protein